MKFIHRAAAMLLVFAMVIPLTTHAADDWAKSRKLTIDTTATGGGVDAAANNKMLGIV